MKKIFIFLTYFLLIFTNISYADEILELEDLENNSIFETNVSISKSPQIFSKNVIVIDRKTLIPLYEKCSYEKVPMASTTKILTCILALENSNFDEKVTISKEASNIHGSTIGLKANTEILMKDLIYGLMLRSGNDCAIAIAEHISGNIDNFSKLMNQKAKELGLSNSNFCTPHGLDSENHFTTAYDLAILTNYALNNNEFKKIVSTKKCIITINGTSREICNTHELLGNTNGVYGVKTGFTFGAGRCLVTSCKRNNLDIIIVVLGADTKNIRTKDTLKLIDYIYSNYSYFDISTIINENFNKFISIFNQNVYLYKTKTFPILSLEPFPFDEIPLSKEEILKLNTKIYCESAFSSNNQINSKVGTFYLYKDDKLIGETSIILKNQIIPNSWKHYFNLIISNFK